MKLEQQLEKLAELGLPLNDGVTVDDLLYSFDREDYENGRLTSFCLCSASKWNGNPGAGLYLPGHGILIRNAFALQVTMCGSLNGCVNCPAIPVI